MTLERVPRVYTAASSHFSVARSARIAGLGPVVPVATTARGAMAPRALQERIEEDLEEGAAPFAVIGTAGPTVTGSIDPLAEIAEICRTHGLWLHVDACYGGAALLIDEQRALFSGIEHANSVALDPHKWFFCPLTASIFLVREKGMDLRTFDCEVSYIPKDPGDESASAWRRGIPTSRRATGITVWMTLRAHGWKTVRTAVRRNIELTRALERRFRDRGFEVLPDGELSIACARFAPTGWTEDEIDQLQNRVAADVSASGAAWFGTVRHQDRTWLCFRLTNLYTREEHIERLVEMVVTTAESQAR
jgi:L-2,4-diaminobutyrate decarboxylase